MAERPRMTAADLVDKLLADEHAECCATAGHPADGSRSWRADRRRAG
jgi:hypothetical protein